MNLEQKQLALMLMYHSNITLLISFPGNTDAIEQVCFLPKHFDKAGKLLSRDFIQIIHNVATIIDWPDHDKRKIEFEGYKAQMEKIILKHLSTSHMGTGTNIIYEICKLPRETMIE